MYSTTGYTMNKAYQIILLSYITIPVLTTCFSFFRGQMQLRLDLQLELARTTSVVLFHCFKLDFGQTHDMSA